MNIPPDINKSKLFVIMPNYNHASYINEALEAILEQSYRPCEVIVVDDGSTDDSVNVIERFVRQDPIVRLLKNEHNIGAVNSYNYGLKYATGDYVYCAATDDKILPGFFEKSMRMLELYPQAGLCCSDVVYFNDLEHSGHIKPSHLSDKACYLSSEEMIKIMRRRYIRVNSGTCLIKRSALIEVGNYIPELKWNCDWFAIYMIIFRRGFCYIPEPLVSQRILRSSYSFKGGHNWNSQKEIMVNIIRLLESSSYSDVQDFFKQSYSLAVFGMPMLYVLLKHRKNWQFLSPFMILLLLGYELRLFLGLRAPFILKKIYYRLLKRSVMLYATKRKK